MTRWYVEKNGNQRGSLSAAELRTLVDSGQLQRMDLVRAEGQTKWHAAGRVRGLFAEKSGAPTPPPLPPQQRSASPSWLQYVYQHWTETKGTLMIPVIVGPFAWLAGSLLKPIIGWSNLAALAVVIGLLSLTTFAIYLVVRAVQYICGQWRVTEQTTCRLARLAHDTGALAFAVMLPLVLVEFFAPERGLLVATLPRLARLQGDLIGNRQPWSPFSQWFDKAFQPTQGQMVERQLSLPVENHERIVKQIHRAYMPVMFARKRKNELVIQEALTKFKQDVAKLNGQKVIWKAKVNRVEQKTVLVFAVDGDYAEPKSELQIEPFFLPRGVLTTDGMDGNELWAPVGYCSRIVIGDGCDEKTARALGRGQTIFIEGEISGFGDEHSLFLTNAAITSKVE
jgi:hypothetical protein